MLPEETSLGQSEVLSWFGIDGKSILYIGIATAIILWASSKSSEE